MSKTRRIQNFNDYREMPFKYALLEILHKRTGAVRSDEIYGAFVSNWEIPKDLKHTPSKWVAIALSELVKIGFISKTGESESKQTGAKLAMYELTEIGREYVISCNAGVVPKIMKQSMNKPKVAEPEEFLDRRAGNIMFALMPAPKTNYRPRTPAAQHIYSRMEAAQ